MTLRCIAPLAFAVAAGTAAFAQPAAPAPADSMRMQYSNGIVAVVEDRIITVADVMRRLAPIMGQIQAASGGNQQMYAQQLEAAQDETIQSLIDEVLILKEFRKDEKRHIPVSFIDNALSDDLVERWEGDRSKFLSFLRSQGKTIRDYRREKEEDIIQSFMRGQQRRSQSIVSPVRIETFYKENKEQFYREDEIHLRIIQLSRNEENTEAAVREKANLVLARVKAGEKFEDIAKQMSDANRGRGGDFGWMQRSSLRPEFAEVAFKLNKGEVSEPLVHPEATYIFYAEDRHFAGIQALDEVRPEIERILLSQMQHNSQERWLERLRRNGYVKHY